MIFQDQQQCILITAKKQNKSIPQAEDSRKVQALGLIRRLLKILTITCKKRKSESHESNKNHNKKTQFKHLN
jgi:hypothetical protein